MFYLEDANLKVGIHPKGAELQSIYHKGHGLEYMWDGNPAFWAKHSPLLFPIVGTLKENTYYYKGRAYSLGRHGFARDMEFRTESGGKGSFTFLLVSDASTRGKFPFDFELRVMYELAGGSLHTRYSVKNPSEEELFFSIGAHPAFRVPLVPDTDYRDYYLEFGHEETLSRWPISKEGLIETRSLPLLDHSRRLPLSKELFSRDALVLKHPLSTSLSLKSDKTERGLRMDFPGFPFLGIWAAPGADFVCIEPWCGIADGVDSDQQLVSKEGVIRLGAGELFERTWTLSFF
jgi:galactose mutarotase-like enzyme